MAISILWSLSGADKGCSLALNVGSGVFSGTLPIAAGRPSSLVLGDLDGDRYLDLVTGSFSGPLSIYFYRPEGGSFVAGQSFGRQGANGLAVGDLNGDGFLDVTVGYGFGGNVAYLNDGDGNFGSKESERRLGSSSVTTTSIAVGDLDGDADLDIVAANGGSRPENSTLYLNDGTGKFDWQGAERDCRAMQPTRTVSRWAIWTATVIWMLWQAMRALPVGKAQLS